MRRLQWRGQLLKTVKTGVIPTILLCFIFLPTRLYSHSKAPCATVLKTGGTFKIIRGNKVWENRIPPNKLQENDQIVTFENGYVTLVFEKSKELIAVRAHSTVTLTGAETGSGMNLRSILQDFQSNWLKNLPAQIGTSVAGIKG